MNRVKAKFNLVKTDQQADDALVQLISLPMAEKLAAKRDEGRGGWWDKDLCDNELLGMMLEKMLDKTNTIIDLEERKTNMVDILNIAAMMWVRLELYGKDA